MDTPDTGGAVNAPVAGVAAAGEQLLVPNLLHLRRAACGLPFRQAYRAELSGLGMGAGLALGLVGLVWLLLKL